MDFYQITIAKRIMDRKCHYPCLFACVFLLLTFIVGCSPTATSPAAIKQGSSKEDVIKLYGKPDRTQEFIIPDEPFFGPQENLIHLVPPGSAIEEWVYEAEDEELYIWFTGDSEEGRESWLVLDLGKYPKDAVY